MRTGRPRRGSYGEAVAAVLRARGVAMSVPQILAEMAGAGLPVPDGPASRRSNTIYVAMSRRPDIFARVSRGLWTLANPRRAGRRPVST